MRTQPFRVFVLVAWISILPRAALGETLDDTLRELSIPRSELTPFSDLFLPPLPPSPFDTALSATEEVEREVRRHVERQAELRAVLGENRIREFRDADFDFELARGFLSSDLFDDPEERERLESAIRGGVLKLWREHLEEELLPRSLLGVRLRGDEEDGSDEEPSVGASVSPRVGLGSRSYLGAKLRVHSEEMPLLSHFSLGLRQRLDRNQTLIDLKFDADGRSFHLYHVLGDSRDGDLTIATVRFSF